MRITKEQLKQIIKEELEAVLSEKTGLASAVEKKAADDAIAGSPDSEYLDNPEYMKAYNVMKDYIERGQPLERDDSPVPEV